MKVGDCLASLEDSPEKDDILKYAVQLWISYSELEINLRQWKKATQVLNYKIILFIYNLIFWPHPQM